MQRSPGWVHRFVRGRALRCVNDNESRGHTRGRPNEANEDAFEADDHLGLYVVCDGAGAEEGGEEASRIAVAATRDHVARLVEGRRFRSSSFSEETAAVAIEAAFDAVYRAASRDPSLARMSTTITMLLLTSERAVVGHVGDSRLYLASDRGLAQLTVDHPSTKLTEGVTVVGVDTFSIRVRPGDVFLLCTDGLRSALEDEDWVLEQLQAPSISSAARRILERAAAVEPDVDATVVLVRVADDVPRACVQHSSSWVAGAFSELTFAGSLA